MLPDPHEWDYRQAQDARGDNVRVLYIGGIGRSGTTLLNRLLGELPGVCAIGEAVTLWRQGILRNEKCSCGQPFYSCSFWQEVGALAFNGWHRVDLEPVLARQSEGSRFRYAREASLMPAFLKPPFVNGSQRRIEALNILYMRLYSAISQVSGCPVVVDASKHASLLSNLRCYKLLDITVIHMIRDSRGVAYSWTKVQRRPESENPMSFMDKFSVAHSAMLWNTYNASFCSLRKSGIRYLRIRYEDLVRTPERWLREIAEVARVASGNQEFTFLGDGYADLMRSHCIAGNPMRFQSGRLAIREDDEWRSALPLRSQVVVTSLTLPLLAHFGYVSFAGPGEVTQSLQHRRLMRGASDSPTDRRDDNYV
jgi:hypothetical protein